MENQPQNQPQRAQSTQSHTPGPWKAEYHGREQHAIIAGEHVVCEIIDRVGCQPRAERSANARLIAAAPDLLAMCKELCQRLEVNELVNRPHVEGNEYDQPTYDRAKAVIDAAEGKQP